MIGCVPGAVVPTALHPGGAFGNLHEAKHPEWMPRGGPQPGIWNVLLPHVVIREPAQQYFLAWPLEQGIHWLQRSKIQVGIDSCSMRTPAP